jgi:hypothetical protein
VGTSSLNASRGITVTHAMSETTPKRLPFWHYMTPEMFRVTADHAHTPRGAFFQKAIVDGSCFRYDSFPLAHRRFAKIEPQATAEKFLDVNSYINAVSQTESGPARFVVSGDALVIVRSNDKDTQVERIEVAASNEATFQRIVKVIETLPTVRTGGGSSTVIGALTSGPCGIEVKRICRERSVFERGNYAPDVVEGLDAIGKELIAKNPSGRFALIEGEPGGGKTRAVRAILAGLKNKCRVIVVPSHLIADLAGPNIIATLRDDEGSNRPTVIVLEDADFALLSREKASEFEREGSTSALDALLNLSDGIIGGGLDLRIVATTNARIEHVDAAILRPGRLIRRVSIGRLTRRRAMAVVARETVMEAAAATLALVKMMPRDGNDTSVGVAGDDEVYRWWRIEGHCDVSSEAWWTSMGPTLAEAYETARRMKMSLAEGA